MLRLAVVGLSFASVAQLEERLICTQQVAGSIPARSSNASVAQLVERWSPKPVVGGSIPSRRANLKSNTMLRTDVRTIISTAEHYVEIYPNDDFDCIVVEGKEIDGTTPSPKLYLNQEELELVTHHMKNMMDYILEGK